jgi:hypothetical protein
MEIELINGRFAIAEAEQLLTAIVKAKIAFHEQKISTIDQSEEDIKHSESRILKLERTLREAIVQLKENNRRFINIHAHIELNFPPIVTQ